MPAVNEQAASLLADALRVLQRDPLPRRAAQQVYKGAKRNDKRSISIEKFFAWESTLPIGTLKMTASNRRSVSAPVMHSRVSPKKFS